MSGPPSLARAAVEGVVCNLLAGADALPAGEGRVLLVGGGARSRAYRQVVADLTGRPVVAVTTEELVAHGAAVQAAAVLHGRSCAERRGRLAVGHDADGRTGCSRRSRRHPECLRRGGLVKRHCDALLPGPVSAGW